MPIPLLCVSSFDRVQVHTRVLLQTPQPSSFWLILFSIPFRFQYFPSWTVQCIQTSTVVGWTKNWDLHELTVKTVRGYHALPNTAVAPAHLYTVRQQWTRALSQIRIHRWHFIRRFSLSLSLSVYCVWALKTNTQQQLLYWFNFFFFSFIFVFTLEGKQLKRHATTCSPALICVVFFFSACLNHDYLFVLSSNH